MNNRSHLTFVAAAGLAAIFATDPALAQMGMGPGRANVPMMGGRGMMSPDCPMMGMMMSGQETRLDQRLGVLKTELGISAAQETAWSAYATVVKKNAEVIRGKQQAMMQAMAMKSPVERLDGHIAAVEEHAKLLKAMKPALTTLYENLSAAQKVKADAVLTARGCMM